MRISARLSSSLLLLAIACAGDDGGTQTNGMPSSSSTTLGTGSTTADANTTDTPGTTTTTMGTTSADPTTGPGPLDSSDSGSDSGTTSAGGQPGDWLLTVDNGSNPPRLMRVELTGGSTPVCSLAGSVDYNSVVFARDGTLYGHNLAQNRIDVIDPCNCSFQILGPTTLGPVALGLGSPGDGDLLAIEPALDALARVDPSTGLGTLVGPLGFFFGEASISWSNLIAQPYAVEGENDFLYTIMVATGESVPLFPLSQDVATPGLAVHPNDNALYLCDADTLYDVDPGSGLMIPIGALGLSGPCRTLTPPQGPLDCIDEL